MLTRIRNVLGAVAVPQPFTVVWRKREQGWLPQELKSPLPNAPKKLRIEYRAWQTGREGPTALHEAYGQKDATRRPNDVRSASYAGDLYAWLARRRPGAIVEFGAAFGVSGMYWLAGLEAAGGGHLYSFEINPTWARLAERNMAAISRRFTLTVGAFEEHVDRVLEGKPIDIAFVDGIHTSDFILRQFEILLARAAKGAILLFDDIDFATGSMREGWTAIWQRPEIAAACEVKGHLGIVELV